MKPASTLARTSTVAEAQFKRFIDKFEPKHRALIRAVRKELRKRLPKANELVYMAISSTCVFRVTSRSR